MVKCRHGVGTRIFATTFKSSSDCTLVHILNTLLITPLICAFTAKPGNI